MSNIDKILEFNREYVANKGYEKHITDKFPDKKLAVLSCMDTRLSVLLQEALGLQNGYAKIIRSFPGHPLMPSDITVRGFIIDSVTGALNEIL